MNDELLVTTVNPDVFIKLAKELEDLQQKYEFERHEKEEWRQTAMEYKLELDKLNAK